MHALLSSVANCHDSFSLNRELINTVTVLYTHLSVSLLPISVDKLQKKIQSATSVADDWKLVQDTNTDSSPGSTLVSTFFLVRLALKTQEGTGDEANCMIQIEYNMYRTYYWN